MIVLGLAIAAWIGALVGAVAMAVVSSERAEHRCRRHYEWDVAAWRFVPVHPNARLEQPTPRPVARHAARR